MDPSGALLSFIHKNAAMGVGAIPQAMSLPQSRAMVPALDRQLREYRAIAAQSQLDPSTSRLAERMIQGSTMGAVQMTRRLHQFTGRADPALVELGQRLLRTEEQNIQEMKRFL